MIQIKKKEDCSGCTACASVCPNGCMEMSEDQEGFKYPEIDKDRCINCRLCEKVCPVKNSREVGKQPKAFLARTCDKNLLEKCTSGGVFTEIAVNMVKSGGIAYGVVIDDDLVIKHKRVENSTEVIKFSGSKYVQSEVGDVFLQVYDDVKAGKNVVFCGTPCQVAGLSSFLGHRYENLYLIDLVCHGVPSPKLWKEYIDYVAKKKGQLCKVNFRSKKLGYHVSVMEEEFENGKRQLGSARTNLMLKCYFQNAADRPICYECPFKTLQRSSDITLFDGWHASKYVDNLIDDDKGYTIVLVHSRKGKELIQKNAHLELYEINTDKAIEADGKMAVNSVIRPEMRDTFYEILDNKGIDGAVQQFFPISPSDKMIEKSKIFFNKIGILQIIKKVKR